MPARDDIMRDYVPVNERISAFLAKHPDGSLQSELIELNEARVVMRAYAYRTPDDQRPGIGYSSLEIPGRTPYTRGSEVENCETSAWGRAIAALGFEVKRGIASAEEVRNKREDGQERPPEAVSGFVGTKAHPAPDISADGGLIGTAITEGNYDFGLRQVAPDPADPDAPRWKLPFRVKNGAKSFIVVAEDALAEAMAPLKDQVVGQRVTVYGHWSDETIPAKGTKPAIHYRILHLERISTPDFTMPMPDALPGPTAGVDGAIGPAELFDEADMAALDAELAS